MDIAPAICLCDLAPALRWDQPGPVDEVLADPVLPELWWRCVAVSRAVAALGVGAIAERLARLAADRYDHLSLGEIVPALHAMDARPAPPEWPATLTEFVRGAGGGWPSVLRLSAGDVGRSAAGGGADGHALVTAIFAEVLRRYAPAAGLADGGPAGRAGVEEARAASPAAGSGQPSPPPAPAAAEPPDPAAPPGDSADLLASVDAAFRGWPQLEHQVAVHRLFATVPENLRALAHRLGVDRDQLRRAQRTAEERVLAWLRSADAAPVTRHLFTLADRFGTAVTEQQLIDADPAHPAVVPSLGAPLWRVLVALMPDRRLQEGWLIAGDLRVLRDRTHQLLAGRPTLSEATELLGTLGIHTYAAQVWLAATPGLDIADGRVVVHGRTPPVGGYEPGRHADPTGAGSAMDGPSLPVRQPGASGHRRHELIPSGSGARHGQLSIADSPRCFRAPDSQWWHRVDIREEHLRGEPVPVAEGYAAHLGLHPGSLLSVTGPGGDAIVLVWRDQPAFDNLRPLLTRLQVRAGDHVFLTVDGSRLEARRLPGIGRGNGGPVPLARALRLIGYTTAASPEEAVRIIARRIGDTDDIDRDGLLRRLAERGDQDILAELAVAAER